MGWERHLASRANYSLLLRQNPPACWAQCPKNCEVAQYGCVSSNEFHSNSVMFLSTASVRFFCVCVPMNTHLGPLQISRVLSAALLSQVPSPWTLDVSVSLASQLHCINLDSHSCYSWVLRPSPTSPHTPVEFTMPLTHPSEESLRYCLEEFPANIWTANIQGESQTQMDLL